MLTAAGMVHMGPSGGSVPASEIYRPSTPPLESMITMPQPDGVPVAPPGIALEGGRR